MKSLKIAFVAALLSLSTSAFATAITPGAGWYGFCFEAGAGNPATEGCQNVGIAPAGNPFQFHLFGVGGTLNVTDAFVFGDTFDVFVNGVLAFTTGGGTHTGSVTTDPDVAFGGTSYDHGSIVLGAGSYTVNIFTHATPGGTGGAYVQVTGRGVGGIPEPGILSLLALGMVGFAAARRRKEA